MLLLLLLLNWTGENIWGGPPGLPPPNSWWFLCGLWAIVYLLHVKLSLPLLKTFFRETFFVLKSELTKYFLPFISRFISTFLSENNFFFFVRIPKFVFTNGDVEIFQSLLNLCLKRERKQNCKYLSLRKKRFSAKSKNVERGKMEIGN